MKVFLGGTCNQSQWREQIKPLLKREGLNYFDPIVDDWNEEAQFVEEKEKQEADFLLYVVTPKMKGVFSIAEVVDDSNKNPEKTVFVVLTEDEDQVFDESELKSLEAVKDMVKKNGAKVFESLDSAASWMGKISKLIL